MSPNAAPRPARARLRPLVLLLLLLLLPFGALAEEPVGIIQVTANVAGAQVWVDGTLVGTVPYSGYHAVGPHQVRVAADHYDPVVRRLDVREALTKSLDAKLEPGVGTVEFAVQPAGARVFVDDNLVGTAPIRVRELQPGAHRYRVEADGHEPVQERFEFLVGQNLLLNIELVGSAGLFMVSSTPEGASVWLDGQQVGVTPLLLEGQELGPHRVRLSLDGYAEVFRNIDTSDGSKGEVTAALSQQGGKLVAKTRNEQATVTINGIEIGQGARVVLPMVDRGNVQLAVAAPGFEPASLTVRVPSRGTVTIKAALSPEGEGKSAISQLPPLYGRWTFWAASTAVVAGGTTGGLLVAKALEPPPPPEGDVLVVLP